MTELTINSIIIIGVIAFLCEYTDSTLGMGYGTTMAPILLLLGFTPLQIVPSILLSELFSGLLGGVMHHHEKNVSFSIKTLNIPRIWGRLRIIGARETFRRGISPHLRVVIMLVGSSLLGVTISVLIASSVPVLWVKLYISILVIAMGVMIIIYFNKQLSFSWKRITFLGFIASFNKGVAGGGYGPLIVSGQILSGVKARNAIGITSLAEGLTCLMGVILYFIFSNGTDISWRLAPIIITGAILALPLSVKSVKVINPQALKVAIATITITLGVASLIKTLSGMN